MPAELTARNIDVLISRYLVGKPRADAEEIRRLVPEVRHMGDRALEQKIEYLRRRVRTRAPAISRR